METKPSAEEYITRFEAARLRGPTRLEDFLPPLGDPERLQVLGEILRIDLEVGWEQGARPSLEAYLRAFPELAKDRELTKAVAFEEYRARLNAGDWPSPAEYRRRYGIELPADATHTAVHTELTADFELRIGQEPALTPPYIPPYSTLPVGRRGLSAGTAPPERIRNLLHDRLRFISLAATVFFAYQGLLTLLNPDARVGLFLEGVMAVGNWIVLLAVGVVMAFLWAGPRFSLLGLRGFEIALFGIIELDLSAGLFDDLFVRRELLEPLARGDHALYHWSSSWCLPFFALIIAYGILVPSGWRRCLPMVAGMAALPLALSFAAGYWEGALAQPFLESYFLQMVVWMGIAASIALFGAVRLEALRQVAEESRTFGPYRLTDLIGKGGMGEVYIAEHALLHRPCALKLIRAEHAGDRRLLQRFEREVQATAKLKHPNTVQVFDFGRADDGTFFFTMEYLPGWNLDCLVKRDGPLDTERVVHILRQICGALQEAHSLDMVHRDVKPSNIILCDLGGAKDFAKLLDFGLAHQPDAATPTRPGKRSAILGTPDFMSPEQTLGSEAVDARSDIYSLGATAYYLLTGRPPFSHPTVAEKLAAHRYESPAPPSSIKKDLPPWLEAAVLRCLAKDPNDRFATAAELSAALGPSTPHGE